MVSSCWVFVETFQYGFYGSRHLSLMGRGRQGFLIKLQGIQYNSWNCGSNWQSCLFLYFSAQMVNVLAKDFRSIKILQCLS